MGIKGYLFSLICWCRVDRTVHRFFIPSSYWQDTQNQAFQNLWGDEKPPGIVSDYPGPKGINAVSQYQKKWKGTVYLFRFIEQEDARGLVHPRGSVYPGGSGGRDLIDHKTFPLHLSSWLPGPPSGVQAKLGPVRWCHPTQALHCLLESFLPELTHYIKIKVLNLVSWERSQRWKGRGQCLTAFPSDHDPKSYSCGFCKSEWCLPQLWQDVPQASRAQWAVREGFAKLQIRGRKGLNSAKCSPVSSGTLFAGDGNVSTPFSNVLEESVQVALCTVIVTQNILKQYSQRREVSIHCT